MLFLVLLPVKMLLLLWQTFNWINYKVSGVPVLLLASVGFYGYYQTKKQEQMSQMAQMAGRESGDVNESISGVFG